MHFSHYMHDEKCREEPPENADSNEFSALPMKEPHFESRKSTFPTCRVLFQLAPTLTPRISFWQYILQSPCYRAIKNAAQALNHFRDKTPRLTSSIADDFTRLTIPIDTLLDFATDRLYSDGLLQFHHQRLTH